MILIRIQEVWGDIEKNICLNNSAKFDSENNITAVTLLTEQY